MQRNVFTPRCRSTAGNDHPFAVQPGATREVPAEALASPNVAGGQGALLALDGRRFADGA
jgi:hypothetical protein